MDLRLSRDKEKVIPKSESFKLSKNYTSASLVAVVKNSPANSGDLGSIPGWGRSFGRGNGTPLQYSCLRIPWTEKPDRLQSMGSQRAGHNLVIKPKKKNCTIIYMKHQILL